MSGVYRVVHDGHRPEHEATLLEDEVFPSCTSCGSEVRFTLAHKGANIRDDKDFSRR